MRGTRLRGQSLVVVVLGLVVLLGILGLAIDMGYLRYMKRQMQTASDAAAVAAAGEIDFGDWKNAGLNAASKNGFKDTTLGGPAIVTITHPVSGADPHAGNNFFVEAKIQQSLPTYFARILGVNSVLMKTRSVAAEGGGNNCIFALSPNTTGLAVDLFAAVISSCGIVVESISSSALQCILGLIQASQIGVVGGVQKGGCTVTPNPKTIKVPVPADPLAAWAAANTPAVGLCGTTNTSPYIGASTPLNLTGTVVLRPGVYCGGIQLLPGAKATFVAGTYILKSTQNDNITPVVGTPRGLTVDLGVTTSISPFNGSDGVTFYNPGPAGAIKFLFTSFTAGNGVKLTAPTSGANEGILFFQPSSNTNTAIIVGTSSFNTKIEGSYYFPNATVNFAFSGLVRYSILVAKSIDFIIFTAGGGTYNTQIFPQDFSSLANGSPIKGGYGVLVE